MSKRERWPSPMIDAVEVARRLGVSRSTAYELIAVVPHMKFGTAIRITEAAFAQIVQGATVAPCGSSSALKFTKRSIKAKGRHSTREAESNLSDPWRTPIKPRTKPRITEPR